MSCHCMFACAALVCALIRTGTRPRVCVLVHSCLPSVRLIFLWLLWAGRALREAHVRGGREAGEYEGAAGGEAKQR